MQNNILQAIANRKSELAFEPVSVSEEIIETLFEASRWAPSSYNEQPWRFYFATRNNSNQFNKALDLLADGNKEWAQNASMIIFSVAKTELSLNGNPNFYALHDTGMATANLMIQAEHLGLASHPIGGFDKDKAIKLLQLPSNYQPVACIVVGVHGNISSLSNNNKERLLAPRTRKNIDEIALSISG